MVKKYKEIIILIASFTLIRLLVAPTFGLGVDEAHYALYARYLDWSYVDHPPLVGWVHALFSSLFGMNEFTVRLPAIILFVFVSWFAYQFMLEISDSKTVALIAALALNCSFLLNAMSLMLLPDCFLMFLIFPLIFVTRKIEMEGGWRFFLYLGVTFGLAGLAKYTAILLVPPFIVYFLLKKRYDILFSPWMFLAAAIALLLIWPVIYWNLKNDFISFHYQMNHVLGSRRVRLQCLLTAITSQAGFYSPFLFAVSLYGLYKSFKAKEDLIRLSLLFGGTILAFFLYSSLREPALPHWSCIFYILFIPLGTYFLLMDGGCRKRNFLYLCIGFSLIVTLFLYAELSAKWIRFPDYKSPFQDIYGYPAIAEEANAIWKQNPNPKKAVAVTNWTMASRVIYYAFPYHYPVFVVDQRDDQFDFWEKKLPAGYDLLFLNSHFHAKDIPRIFQCDRAASVKKIDIMLNGGKVDSIEYIWCYNFQGWKDK
ncbi:MAG: glycosyltransferase family 39 protein [bacterium]